MRSENRKLKLAPLALALPLAFGGCGMMDDLSTDDTHTTQGAASVTATFNVPGGGTMRIASVNGASVVDTSGAFFNPIGLPNNGRKCQNCHQQAQAMGITPPAIQAVFNATQGLDPVFRLNDGANGPLARVGTLAERSAAYSLLRTKGLIRIPLQLPANRDFDVKVVLDPYAGTGANPPVNQTVPATASPILSFYRRPLLSANTRFISAVMWDGREATINPVPSNPRDTDNNGVQAFQTNAPVFQNMLIQSNNATRGHAEAQNDITTAQRNEIVNLQMNLVVAMETDPIAGALNAAGATGGANALRTQNTFFGINDSHGGNPFGTAFNPSAMTMFNAWTNIAGTDSVANRRRAIARGQAIFNTRTIRISNVRGVNDALGVATLNGSCTTCHSHPNVGNHPDILPLDLGISNPAEGDNVLPVFSVTNRATQQRVETTDLGRAVLTGRFADLNKQKGPTLRALKSRAPFFHNGAADNIDEVISFYDRRFGMGLTAQEISDLKAFLESI